MQILKSPYIIIAILGVFVILLVGLAIAFAVRGLKTATGDTGNDFIAISKIENNFKKLGKLREERCVSYISISFENLQDSHLKAKVFSKMKGILCEVFSEKEQYEITIDAEKNFIVFAKSTVERVREDIERYQGEVNKCLSEHSVLNLVEVRSGIYYVVGTTITFDEAVSRAKQACLLAKDEKRPYAEWDVVSGKALQKKIKIENSIEKEIDNNNFFLEYQPVLDAKTKKIIGAEVLSRLNSESEGILTPRSFLSAMNSVGIQDKFDYYIFEKNCKWISNDKKQREGYKYTINFSRTTLCEPAFAEKIIGIAEKYDLQFSCLAVEILEDKNVTGEAKKQMIDNLSMLKEKGVSILLDDFGSGYTTFGDLQNFDVSIVKIDKSITQGAVTDTGFIILKNIIQTSKDIGFKTLCEGIETKEHEEAAINAGCDLLQGYYYYRPMPVAMLERVLEEDLGGN